jgi:hypothetical integral membrane protein (TIGR02206 family)
VVLVGPLHIALLAGTAAAAVLLMALCRRVAAARRTVRLLLGFGLALNELVWWAFRYSHEGLHLWNLPLQLCDVTLWATVVACLTLAPALVEFAYFAGLAGAAMALLTPDLWSPWPTYPAIYFFLVHGGIVVGIAVLVMGGIAPLRAGAVWRASGMLAGYAASVGVVNAIFGTNFMYLCRKPANPSLLDVLGPWPIYLVGGSVLALALFWLLWLPVRPRGPHATRIRPIVQPPGCR